MLHMHTVIHMINEQQQSFTQLTSSYQLESDQDTSSHRGKDRRHGDFGNAEELLRHHPNFTRTQRQSVNSTATHH